MRPRAQGPSDTDGGHARRELDAGWDEVLDPAEATSADAAVPGDEPRAAPEDAPADAGPRVAESSAADLPTATLEQESNEPDDRLHPESSAIRAADAMMSGSWALATRDGSAPTAVPEPGSDRALHESDAEMAALMGTRESTARAGTPAAEPRSTVGGALTVGEARPRMNPATESTEILAVEPPTRPKTGPMGEVRPVATAPARRMPSPEPRRITARTSALELGAKPKRLSLGWAVLAGVGIAGIAWIVGGPIRSPSSPHPNGRATTDAKAAGSIAAKEKRVDPPANLAREPSKVSPESVPANADGPQAHEAPPTDPEPATETPVAPPKPAADMPPVATDRPREPGNRGVRTPPPGTPPEIAATFVRLPVSPADLPPVGGVGSSGIHVDRIEMGASYDNKTGCVGVAKEFSLAANEEINVCLRVVHPRQDEVMSIVWQKADGSTARRGKIAVKPIHAYRTRAYLRLRAEYIGAWTVRITAPDGVELASHAFTITP